MIKSNIVLQSARTNKTEKLHLPPAFVFAVVDTGGRTGTLAGFGGGLAAAPPGAGNNNHRIITIHNHLFKQNINTHIIN